ncbi:MAG: photosystem II complex extrinsic protein PsbU [Microcoleaceae cyanobacterium]
MKRFGCILAVLTLWVSCLGWMGTEAAQASQLSLSQFPVVSPILAVEQRANRADQKLAEFGDKIDLNNSSLRDFREFRGMYPTLGKMIIANTKYKPFDSVEQVLEMPGLTEKMKSTLELYLDKFTVTPPSSILKEGDFRLNTGIYD